MGDLFSVCQTLFQKMITMILIMNNNDSDLIFCFVVTCYSWVKHWLLDTIREILLLNGSHGDIGVTIADILSSFLWIYVTEE